MCFSRVVASESRSRTASSSSHDGSGVVTRALTEQSRFRSRSLPVRDACAWNLLHPSEVHTTDCAGQCEATTSDFQHASRRRPRGPFRFKRHAFFGQRMVEPDPVRMQAERGVVDRERLRFADSAIGEIRRVANDGEAEMPERHSDLIRAPCTFARGVDAIPGAPKARRTDSRSCS